VRKGHDISERVKYELIEKGPNVLDVVVHLEPYQ
jgi:divalent metal cation (Fe/Co/Zn/Cd) transporter